MKLGMNGSFTKISKSVGSIQQLICWWLKTSGDEKSHKKCPSCKGKVQFLCSSPSPAYRCSKSRRCVKPWRTAESQVKQGVSRYKLCTKHLHPSNYVKVVNLDLNLSIHEYKQQTSSSLGVSVSCNSETFKCSSEVRYMPNQL